MLVNIKAPTLQADVSDTGSPSPNSWTVCFLQEESTSMSAWRTDPACKPVRGSNPKPQNPNLHPQAPHAENANATPLKPKILNVQASVERRVLGPRPLQEDPKHQGKLGGYWAARSQQQGHKVLKEILKGTKKSFRKRGTSDP